MSLKRSWLWIAGVVGFLGLAIFFLTGEWILRKRKHLL